MGEVVSRAARAAWGHFLPPRRLAGFAMAPGRLAGAVSAAAYGSIALVAEDDAGVVGFVVGGPAVDGDVDPRLVGLIDLLYVTPTRWGEGAGRSLMCAALVRMASSGRSEAVLWTARDNTRPREVYVRFGWRLDGAERRRVALGVPITEVRYRIATRGWDVSNERS
jgi:GNAT superfamily N-acetyltransferase